MTTTTTARQTELDIFAAFSMDANAPAPKVSPAELKAETLYSKTRQGKISYEAAMKRMPKTAAARKWERRLVAEFGPNAGLLF